MDNNDRRFQSIKRPPRDEDSLLEALAARKGVGRMQSPQEALTTSTDSIVELERSGHSASTTMTLQEVGQGAKPPRSVGGSDPTPRTHMKAMNLELPDYVMHQLKQQAMRDDCSVRHVIMRCLAAQGIIIRGPDMITDGRRNRGKSHS